MATWEDLERELNIWLDQGHPATFWWRDDDAYSWSRSLRRLLRLGESFKVPVALAVIPDRLEHTLASFLEQYQQVTVLQHGWSHKNHAPPGDPKCELWSGRTSEGILKELQTGLSRHRELFPKCGRDILVPPWGRIDGNILPFLRDLGFTGISIGGPRSSESIENLHQANVHAEIIDWSKWASSPQLLRWAGNTRAWFWSGALSFIGTDNILEQVMYHLRARRMGEVDRSEPTGLLTHHSVHDEPCWVFIEQFLSRTLQHPGVQWVSTDAQFSTQ